MEDKRAAIATHFTNILMMSGSLGGGEPDPIWDLTNAAYDSKFFDFTSEDTFPLDFVFNDDGTKMYTAGDTNNKIFQYTLSTAWDISTASYDSKFLDISGQDSSPQGIHFKPDGTKVYLAGDTNNSVFQYTLSTPWDISTGSYDSKLKSIATEDGSILDVFFKDDDGTKMYITGNMNDSIFQYTLSTPWDVSTATYDSKSFVTAQDASPQSLHFKDDGSKVFIAGGTNKTLYQYTLSTPWDISTTSYDSVSFDVSSEVAILYALRFGNNGTLLYVMDPLDHIYQYTL